MYNYYFNRSAPIPPPPPPKKPNSKTPPKNKFNFKTFKINTCKSLNDVEYFLNNFTNNLKYYRLIKILK